VSILVVLLASLVGLSLGLLGGGGSILTVPILRYVVGLEAHRAVALSLLVVGTTSAAALVPHALAKRVRWRTGLVFGAAGMTGAFAAGRVAQYLPAALLLIGFGVMMFATSMGMLRGRRAPTGAAVPRELPVRKVIVQGLAVGGAAGLVGAGGGFLVVPALVLLGGLPMEVAVGTSLLVISLQSFAGFVGFLGHTPIDWTLGLWVSASAVVGSIVGSLLAGSVSPARLRSGFGWFVVAMAFFVLGQEVPRALGSALPLPLVVALSTIGTLVVAALRWTAGRSKSVAAEAPAE
jgi:uncharacterized membrane protein YfcA